MDLGVADEFCFDEDCGEDLLLPASDDEVASSHVSLDPELEIVDDFAVNAALLPPPLRGLIHMNASSSNVIFHWL